MPQSPSPSSLEQVRQALRRAFQLGQTYWMHADSESLIQHQKADVVQARFDALVEETCAALSAVEALGQAEPIWQSQCKDGTWADCTEANARAAEMYGFKARALYASPAALQPPPSQLGRWGVKHVGGEPWFERMAGGYWTPWHLAVQALQQQEAGSLTDERILHLWDTHVGEPSAKLPLNDKDKLAFARAVLGACAPSPTEPAAGVPATYGSIAERAEAGKSAGLWNGAGVTECCHRTSPDAPHARWCPAHGEGADGVAGPDHQTFSPQTPTGAKD